MTHLLFGACQHADRRCDPCIRRAMEVQLRLRRELTMPLGQLASLGRSLGGPIAWTRTLDAKIAELVCELVVGVSADSIMWKMIDRQTASKNS